MKRISDTKIIRDLRIAIECTIPAVLTAYEHTGDHDHGGGPLQPGATCPGGDCLVTLARRLSPNKDPLVEVLRGASPEEVRAVWHVLAAMVENEEADDAHSKHHAFAMALCSRLDAAMAQMAS